MILLDEIPFWMYHLGYTKNETEKQYWINILSQCFQIKKESLKPISFEKYSEKKIGKNMYSVKKCPESYTY